MGNPEIPNQIPHEGWWQPVVKIPGLARVVDDAGRNEFLRLADLAFPNLQYNKKSDFLHDIALGKCKLYFLEDKSGGCEDPYIAIAGGVAVYQFDYDRDGFPGAMRRVVMPATMFRAKDNLALSSRENIKDIKVAPAMLGLVFAGAYEDLETRQETSPNDSMEIVIGLDRPIMENPKLAKYYDRMGFTVSGPQTMYLDYPDILIEQAMEQVGKLGLIPPEAQ